MNRPSLHRGPIHQVSSAPMSQPAVARQGYLQLIEIINQFFTQTCSAAMNRAKITLDSRCRSSTTHAGRHSARPAAI